MISKRDYYDDSIIDMSKRYWYCCIDQYYPCGFPTDIEATCDTLDELRSLKKEEELSYEWEVFWDNEECKEISI